MNIRDIFKNPFNSTTTDNNESQNNEVIRYCCSCGAPETDVDLIIRMGPDNFVCEKCAALIHSQMTELYDYAANMQADIEEAISDIQDTDEEPTDEIEIPTPHEIKEYLDQYVVGQDEAKIKLSVAVYNHYKRIYQLKDDVDIAKSNTIVLGNPGSGKTLLAQTISKMLDVPIALVDANCFTQAGYVGEDVESILTRLYQAAGNDVNKAERGIVFIDEIDKIARAGDSPSISKDVSGEGVQQALLKLLEGSKIRITPDGGRKHPEKEMIEIDTTNILFICSGAFVGIEKNIGRRLNTKTVGFSNDPAKKKVEKDLIKYVTSEDLRSFGLIPELIGRLPVITYVDELDKPTLKRILLEPKNAVIKQYKKLIEMDGAKLVFEDDALDFIVEKAYAMKIGARGLRSIVEEIMTQYMYDLPSTNRKRVTITKKYAEEAYNKKHQISLA